MTVSTSQRRVAYAGNGVTTVFAVPFPFPAAGDVRVVRTVAGAESALVLNVDYTVTGAGNPGGGTVTITPPPASGQTITIRRVVARTQETDYVPNDPFPAESHEAALDKLTMITQEDGDDLGRALLVPDTDPRRGEMILPTVAGRAGKMMSMDAMGRPEFGISTAAVAAAIALATAPGAAQLADNVAYAPPGAGAQPTNVAEVLRRTRSVFDFFTPAQINDVAIGFGALDVSAALNAAHAAVQAAGGGAVHWPAGRYNVGTDTVECPENVTIIADPGAYMVQSLAATGTALRILGRSFAVTERRPRHFRLPQVIKGGFNFQTVGGWLDGTDTSSIGVEIKNCSDDYFYIAGAFNFHKGVDLWSTFNGVDDFHLCVNNTLMLGNVRNNKFGISGRAGANSITVIGGVCNCDAGPLGAWASQSSSINLGTSTDVEANHWTIIGTNLEGSPIATGQVALNCYTGWNHFINLRFEKLPANAIKFRGASAVYNRVSGGPDSALTGGIWNALFDPAHRGFDTVVDAGRTTGGRDALMTWWGASTPDEPQIRLGNGASLPNVGITTFGNNRLYLRAADTTGPDLAGVRYQGNMHQETVTINSGTGWVNIPANGVIADYASPATVVFWTDPSVGSDVTARWYIWSPNGNLTLQHTASPTAGRFFFASGVNKTLAANEVVSGITINGIRYAD